MQPAQPQAMHWKDRAIIRSEAITDAWEVTKIYAGRCADWVLFFCLVANIIQILPGVAFFPVVANTIVGTQAISLDIAGFGLAGMADHARANGNKKGGWMATITAWFLIGLMMVTVTLITIGILWPGAKQTTDMADKILILVRVAATVWYGHVVHSLRSHGSQNTPQNQPVQTPDYSAMMQQFVSDLRAEMQSSLAALHGEISKQIDAKVPTFEPPDIDALVQTLDSKIAALESRLQAQIPAPLDLPQLALELAPLVQIANGSPNDQSVLSGEQVEDQEENETPNEIDQDNRTNTEQEPNTQRLRLVNKSANKQRTTETSEAAQKIKRLLRKDRTIGPTELASKCGCSKSYASEVKRAFLREQPA